MSPLALRSAPIRLVFTFALACAGRPAADTTAVPGQPVAAEAQPASLDALSFLVGTWVVDTPEGRVTERWAREGDALAGNSETVAGDQQAFHEDLRIEIVDGVAIYLASPMGRTPPVEFRRSDDGTIAGVVVFENPAHDYPKRIRYERQGDRLTATIAGDGRGATWEYRRQDPHRDP